MYTSASRSIWACVHRCMEVLYIQPYSNSKVESKVMPWYFYEKIGTTLIACFCISWPNSGDTYRVFLNTQATCYLILGKGKTLQYEWCTVVKATVMPWYLLIFSPRSCRIKSHQTTLRVEREFYKLQKRFEFLLDNSFLQIPPTQILLTFDSFTQHN